MSLGIRVRQKAPRLRRSSHGLLADLNQAVAGLDAGTGGGAVFDHLGNDELRRGRLKNNTGGGSGLASTNARARQQDNADLRAKPEHAQLEEFSGDRQYERVEVAGRDDIAAIQRDDQISGHEAGLRGQTAVPHCLHQGGLLPAKEFRGRSGKRRQGQTETGKKPRFESLAPAPREYAADAGAGDGRVAVLAIGNDGNQPAIQVEDAGSEHLSCQRDAQEDFLDVLPAARSFPRRLEEPV